jgi:hypothetical protein
MVMKSKKYLYVGIVALVSMFFAQCGLFTGPARVYIDLGGARSQVKAASGSSKAAPSNITGFTLTITGKGMDSIVQAFDPGVGIVSILVPAGAQRRFEVEANLDLTATPNAHVQTFKGIAYADLSPNEVSTIALRMIPGNTRLLVPDYNNHRITMMVSFGGGIAGTYPVPTAPDASFWPNDMDLDASGRIYVGYRNIQGLSYIVRLNSIDDPAPVMIQTSDNAQVIGIDKARNLLYYTNSSSSFIFRINLNLLTGAVASEDMIEVFSEGVPQSDGLGTNGLDVDTDGNLFFNSYNRIIKMNPLAPAGSRLAAIFSDPTSIVQQPFDVVVMDRNVYVSNQYGSSGTMILEFKTSNLGFVGSNGNPYSSLPSTAIGEFYSPERFISVTNKDMYLIDEINVPGVGVFNRIVRFSDIGFINWGIYDANKDGYIFYDGF